MSLLDTSVTGKNRARFKIARDPHLCVRSIPAPQSGLATPPFRTGSVAATEYSGQGSRGECHACLWPAPTLTQLCDDSGLRHLQFG